MSHRRVTLAGSTHSLPGPFPSSPSSTPLCLPSALAYGFLKTSQAKCTHLRVGRGSSWERQIPENHHLGKAPGVRQEAGLRGHPQPGRGAHAVILGSLWTSF